jgi:hypothetical protein
MPCKIDPQTLVLSDQYRQRAMIYHQVQFLTLVQTEWVTLKEFDDSTGALLPVTDSAEELSLEEAETRLVLLSRKYPFLTFRINKVIL